MAATVALTARTVNRRHEVVLAGCKRFGAAWWYGAGGRRVAAAVSWIPSSARRQTSFCSRLENVAITDYSDNPDLKHHAFPLRSKPEG